ncbi:hypothetical protein VTI74DRAFT_10957 [Chaetomium olivicolor]
MTPRSSSPVVPTGDVMQHALSCSGSASAGSPNSTSSQTIGELAWVIEVDFKGSQLAPSRFVISRAGSCSSAKRRGQHHQDAKPGRGCSHGTFRQRGLPTTMTTGRAKTAGRDVSLLVLKWKRWRTARSRRPSTPGRPSHPPPRDHHPPPPGRGNTGIPPARLSRGPRLRSTGWGSLSWSLSGVDTCRFC